MNAQEPVKAPGSKPGRESDFGKTARLVQEAHTVSHFQRAVLKIGDHLIILAVALVVLILSVALFRGGRGHGSCNSRCRSDTPAWGGDT